MRRDRIGLFVLSLMLAVAGCRRSANDEGSSQTLTEPTVEKEVDGLEQRLAPAVLERIRDREAWRDRILAEADLPDERRAEAFAEVAMLHHAYDLFEPAVDAYGRALALAPNDHRWFYLRGMARRRLNELEGAAGDFTRATELAPDDVPSRVRLGEVAADRGESERAEETLSTALELDPDCAAAHFALGQLARTAGDLEAAAAYFERVLELQPDTSGVRTPLGLTYRDLGREDEARAQLEAAGEQRVRLADPLLQRIYELGEGWNAAMREARALAQNGDLQAAEEALETAIRMDPLSTASRLAWAGLLLADNQIDAAREQAELVRFLSSDDLASGRLRAQIALATEDWAEAEVLLRRLTASPRAARSDWLSLGAVLERSAEVSEALVVYRKLRNRYPDDTGIVISEASQLIRLDRCVEARDIVAAQVSRRANDGLLAHAESRLLSVCGGDDSAARAMALAESLFAAAETAGHAEAVALARAAAGRFDEAIDWQRRAIQLAGDGPAGEYHEAVLRRLDQQSKPPVPWPPLLRTWIFGSAGAERERS